MNFDLNRYFLDPDASGRHTFAFQIDNVEINGVNPFKKAVEVQAAYRNDISAVQLVLETSYVLSLPCDRCFESFQREEKQSFCHAVVKNLADDEDDDGKYILAPNGIIDIQEVVYQDMILSLPAKFLCSEHCKGICSICGTNLNQATCDCHKDKIDPRLMALRELLDNDET